MKHFQRGSASVEIAITSVIFLWLMFAVIEVGRVMYTWNALTEASRLGARAASVCQVQDDVIASIATFDGGGLLAGLDKSNIIVNYLDDQGAVVANPTPANEWGFLQVKYVQVSIQGYEFKSLVSGLGTFTLPTFSTTLPRESLGIIPNEAAGC